MAAGWIKVHRSLLSHWIWQDNLRLKAWLDILLRANHETNKMMWNGSFITLKSGQFITSKRKLANSWHCCKDTACKIIKEFIDDGMITCETPDRRYTIITVVNYGLYQKSTDSKQDSKKDTEQDSKQDSESTQTRMSKNDYKNVKEEKKTASGGNSLGGRWDPSRYE